MKNNLTTRLSFKSYFELGSSNFVVSEDFCKSDYEFDADELVSEVTNFLNKFSKFLINDFNDSIQQIEIEIVSIPQIEIIEEFYEKLILNLGNLSYVEVICSEEVKKGMNDEQIENIDDVFFCMKDKLIEQGVIK